MDFRFEKLDIWKRVDENKRKLISYFRGIEK